jgi:hypothetical protein
MSVTDSLPASRNDRLAASSTVSPAVTASGRGTSIPSPISATETARVPGPDGSSPLSSAPARPIAVSAAMLRSAVPFLAATIQPAPTAAASSATAVAAMAGGRWPGIAWIVAAATIARATAQAGIAILCKAGECSTRTGE